MKRNSLAILAAAALAVAFAGCKPKEPVKEVPKKSANAVKLEFFVMSQCPFGVQVVNAVKDVVDKLGPDLDFQMNFIGGTGPNGELTSMHGPDEVSGDMVQLCAAKYAPEAYLEMVACQNKNYREVAKNWEQCAQAAKLPVEKIRGCFTGDEGKQLLTASFNLAKERKATGSPTIFLAGKPFTGRRGTTDLFRAVCAEFTTEPKPAACSNIPEPPKVAVTVLTDKRCADCNPDRYVNMLKFRLSNPEIKVVDYADADGKAIYEGIGTGNLPMILFDKSLDADQEGSSMFARHLRPAGTFRNLDIGASWNPVCMNEGGCELEQCKQTMACRKEVPGRLEVFVMSQCPFGVRALNSMEEVLKNFSNKIDFQVHFIASGTAEAGFQALHGQPEVEENIRELCAIKNYGKAHKYMDYVLCRNKDIRSTEWQACTGKNGIATKVMEKCIAGEGKKLHEDDIKIANGLGIGASPTWVVNGKYKFSGTDAETIRKNFCEHNPNTKGCENTLTGPQAGAPSHGGCGK